ncbi:MAG: uracil-DNA glycosylase [Granulosicoccus sp.]|jgi:uracil-DNA glycosylase
MSDKSQPIQRSNINIEASWKDLLYKEFKADYFHRLIQFVKIEKDQETVYPPGSRIFAAFDHTPVEKVKVVIIGQDPYHGPNQANGLCFSVSKGIKPPPSLRNMFKELAEDVGFEPTGNGDLESWADQGVLLVNATLSVRAGQPGSHQKQGWEQFTDAVIQSISQERAGLVFLLWGRFAQNKESLIADNDHLILKAAHPSPFSAYNGFFGCKHFSKTNSFLKQKGESEINWQI